VNKNLWWIFVHCE